MSRTSRRLADLIHGIDRVVPILENSGPGGTVQLEKDDLLPKIVDRLADYASAVTIQAANEFPVTNVPGRFGLEDATGNPSGIRPPGENNQAHFTSAFTAPSPDGRSAEVEFDKTSESGQLDVPKAKGDRFVIKKGKTSVIAPTGMEIYQDINENGEKSDFAKRVREVQFENNHFTLGKSYVPRTGLDAEGISVQAPGSSGSTSVAEDDSNIGVSYTQQEFGKHGPRKFPTSEGQSATLVKLKDLKKIALLTMLQASGEYYIPTDPNDVAQQLAAKGASLAPGLARLGQKIDMARTRPLKIMKDIDPDFQKISLDDNIKKDAVLSYGSVNNWMTPFSGLSSTASVACAALLTLTIGGLLKGAAQIISPKNQVDAPPSEANPAVTYRRQRLGSFLGKGSEASAFRNTDLALQVSQTGHDYFQCVSRGIDIFFGSSTPGVPSFKVLDNHGYFNTVLRSLVRSTTDFIKLAAGGVVNPEGVRDINDVTIIGNPLGSIEMLTKLNSSQLLKFCNIMATLGDIALNHQDDGFLLDSDGDVDEYISDIDAILAEADIGPGGSNGLNPAVLQSINRLPGGYRNALAWGSNTVQSMYMFPNGLFKGEARYLGASDQSKSPSEAAAADLSINGLHQIKGPDGLSGNRISAEDVKALEESLEADYVPFYFHDIRTNEIISFHAFLEDVNDSFDAEYTDIGGYGRIGDVMIYKNTKRSISLGFRVVATNHTDFDHMWWKINKLVTLVYPQYTEGRQVGTATDKFIQPFSQVPSASPLVRLRLGDVFKGNYTKFGLARLFGVGSSQFSLQGADGTIAYDANMLAQRNSVARRMSHDGQYQANEFAKILPLQAGIGRGSGQRLRGYARVGDKLDSASQPGQSSRRGRGGRTGAGSSVQGFLTTTANGPPQSRNSRGRPLMVDHLTRVQITEASEENGVKIYKFTVPNGGVNQDGVYICSQYNLVPDGNEIARVAFNQSADTGTTPTAQSSISTFFSSDGQNGNPIIKAFESTAGKGLAGFIKSMRFDWNESRWETGRHNARAPMNLKISMEFAPIHDINPGLDSEGFMTAPVYNVGDTVKNLTEMPDQRNQNNTDIANMARAINAAIPRSGNGSGNDNGSGTGGGTP